MEWPDSECWRWPVDCTSFGCWLYNDQFGISVHKAQLGWRYKEILFLHHIHAHEWKFLLKYKWFSNLHFYSWFYYLAPDSIFRFSSGQTHIDNTLLSQLNHLPTIPNKSAFLLSHILTHVIPLVVQENNFCPYLSPHHTHISLYPSQWSACLRSYLMPINSVVCMVYNWIILKYKTNSVLC